MNRFLLLFLSAFFAKNAQAADFSKLAQTDPPTIACPASDSFRLNIGRCDTVLYFAVTATDAQGEPIAVVQTEGQPSGSAFQPGTHTFTFEATDGDGNTATCSFTFRVYEFDPINLTCDDLITVSLGDNCAQTLAPHQILQGGPYGCWDHFLVEVDKVAPFGNGPWVTPTFTAADIDKQYQVRVTDTRNNNKCWGFAQVRDLTGPVIICPAVTVSCSETNTAPGYLQDELGLAAAYPSANDACQAFDLPTYTDLQTLEYGCDSIFAKVLLRRWEVADLSGNTSTCVQRVQFHRHLVGELQVPQGITLSCPDDALAPEFTGKPFLDFDGRRYELDDNLSLCELAAFYTDARTRLDCGNQRIGRAWRWFDFCTGENTGPFLQTIFVLDQTGPSIACPPALTVSVAAVDCKGPVGLPDVVLSDACSQLSDFQAKWLDADGMPQSLNGVLEGIPGNDPGSFDTLGVLGSAIFAIGTTEITYLAADSCGNTGTCSFLLTVADLVPPSAVCQAAMAVTLATDGTLSLPAAALDNGSADDCNPALSFRAKFESPNACSDSALWAESLTFCCALRFDTVVATLRVYDIPLPSGAVADDYGTGHFSECAVSIEVLDPHPPTCVAPPDVAVECAQFDPTLAAYGGISASSCAVDSVAVEVDYSQFDQTCRRGTLARSFIVFDQAGNSSQCGPQHISVDYLQEYYIKFPDDALVTACSPTQDYGQPATFGLGCEDLDISFTDQIFSIVPDACYYIERTWAIVNRCTYDSLAPLVNVPNPAPDAIINHPANRLGPIVAACDATAPWQPTTVKINHFDAQPTNFCVFWSQNANGYRYKQVIKVLDAIPPTGTFTAPTCANQNWEKANNPFFWNEPYWNDPLHQSQDLCEQPTSISIVGTDACAGKEVTVEYLLRLDLDNDGLQETVIRSDLTGPNGIGWNNVPFNNYLNGGAGTPRAFDSRPVPNDQKMGFAIERTVSGNTVTAKVRWNTQAQPNVFFDPELPIGSHRIAWNITDQCGNNREYTYDVTVRDCRPPNVVCKSNLTFDLQPSLGNEVTVLASELFEEATDNCTPAAQLAISMRECGTGVGFPLGAQAQPVGSLQFTCNDLGAQCIEVWARDKSGSADKCEIEITIDDNLLPCNSVIPELFGWVRTPLAKGIGEVDIRLEASQAPPPPAGSLAQTDTFGYYHIASGSLASHFFVVPDRNDNPLNGVTTFDLVLISKHILGTEPFDSPYKMVAADANKSGSITTFDIVELRKLILGIYDTLPIARSWRFIDSAFAFPNPQNPFQTAFPERVALANGSPVSFVGVKVGDVNLTAEPHAQGPADERHEGTAYLDAPDRQVAAGELLQVPFSLATPAEGCQFSLEAEGLELLETLPGEGTAKEHFALYPEKSLLVMSWEKGGQAQFLLRARATKPGALRDMLRLSDRVARPEAYPLGGGAPQRLALRFGGAEGQAALFQNQPNPFSDKTSVSFQLPQAATATLRITDATGRTLWSKTAAWPAGLHTVEADLSGSGQAGVLFCHLETAEQNLVRKMVRY